MRRSEPDVAAGAGDCSGGGRENTTEEGGSRTRGPSGARSSVTPRRDTSSSPNFFGHPAKRRTEYGIVSADGSPDVEEGGRGWTHCWHIMGRRADWRTKDANLRKRLGRRGMIPPYLP